MMKLCQLNWMIANASESSFHLERVKSAVLNCAMWARRLTAGAVVQKEIEHKEQKKLFKHYFFFYPGSDNTVKL